MGILAATVGANVADGHPDEARHRLGSPLPAAKSADRVLKSSDAGSKLRVPAAGATKGSHSRSWRRKGRPQARR
jgi:hypothetical protein